MLESDGGKWYADSDTAYDLYIFIDNDGNGEPSGSSEETADLIYDNFFPKEYSSINSDITISVDSSQTGDSETTNFYLLSDS